MKKLVRVHLQDFLLEKLMIFFCGSLTLLLDLLRISIEFLLHAPLKKNVENPMI